MIGQYPSKVRATSAACSLVEIRTLGTRFFKYDTDKALPKTHAFSNQVATCGPTNVCSSVS